MPLASLTGSSLVRAAGVLAAASAFTFVAGCGDSSESGGSGGGGGGNQITATTGDGIFKDACASCHTLAAAGAKGAIGPNLDNVKPDAGVVTTYVNNGEGSMPSFKGRLSDAQIKAVADYVSSVAGQ